MSYYGGEKPVASRGEEWDGDGTDCQGDDRCDGHMTRQDGTGHAGILLEPYSRFGDKFTLIASNLFYNRTPVLGTKEL